MAPQLRKHQASKLAAQASTKAPTPNLKRKRSNNGSGERLNNVIKSIRADRGLPIAASIENGGSPPRDTTSETSGLSSVDEANSRTSATGLDTEDSKQASEVRILSDEGSRVAEVVTAYRNAIEILLEIANRDRHRAYGQPYIGPIGPVTYTTPYASCTVGTYTRPYANGMPNTYTTPYSNPTPTNYVTPYSNPPVIAGPSGAGQSNEVIEPKTHAFDHPGIDNRVSQSNVDGINAEMATNGIDDIIEGFKGTAKADDEVSLSSALNIDNFLALANGGVPPGQNIDSNDSDSDDGNQFNDATALDAPPSPADTIDDSMSRADEDIQALVSHIANELMHSEEPPNGWPPGNPYAASYSTMNGQQLGAELKRLIAVAHPEVNAIMPKEQIQAVHLFYTHLASRAHARQAPDNRLPQFSHGSPVVPANQWGQAVYPPPPPKGYMVQWHDSFTGAPLQPPPQLGQPFVPRGNVIAPPGARDVEEERKVATYGFPPKPGRRPGLRSGGKRAKKKD